jgi:hypothetical protein
MSIFDRIRAAAQKSDSSVIEQPLSRLKVSGVRRDSLGRVMKGSPSPNPKGGPAAALARRVMARTNNLETVVDFMTDVLHADIEVAVMTSLGTIETVGPSIKERIEAAKWLAERGAGKAADIIKIEHEDVAGSAIRIDPARVRPEDLLKLLDVAGQVLDYQQSQIVEGEVLPALAAQAGNTPSESEE